MSANANFDLFWNSLEPYERDHCITLGQYLRYK